jgi:hypothetical protein
VKTSPEWAKLRESTALLDEQMGVVFIHKKRSDSDERDCKRMCVLSLRRKLDERGLDVDGSREMLICRLEEGENDDGGSNEDN